MAGDQLKQAIYRIISAIPRGKVVTYGQVALMAGTGPRVVGNVLHANTQPETFPCHRVVMTSGRLASGYAFGGCLAQEERLRGEGIEFVNKKTDLTKYLWRF